MSKLTDFRKANRLKQTEIADFLGVGKSFISQIEHGLATLPSDKLRMLIDNEEGWDISPLVSDVKINVEGDAALSSNGNATIYHNVANSHRIKELERRVEELKAEVVWLRSIIDKLSHND